MKIKKAVRTYCKKCGKHTEQKVAQAKKKGRGAAHPMSHGSTKRLKARGERRGAGGHGRYSRPTKPKMSGKKLSKKTDLRYTCKVCNKTQSINCGLRSKKIELI